MKKNYLLKTKGVLRCCTLCEIIVPVIFLGLMCLPKLFVEDSRSNDELTRPYSLSGGIESIAYRSLQGFRFVASPATADTMQAARLAYVHASCLSLRSVAPDAASATSTDQRSKAFFNQMHDQAYASSNVAAGVKSAFETLAYDYNGGLTAACSNACLRDQTVGGCFETTWDAILDEVVVTKTDETEALEYINDNAGEILAYARFDSGGDFSSTTAFDYTLRMNTTNFAYDDTQTSEYMSEDFLNRWESEFNVDYWKDYKAFMYAQNAFDAAIIDIKDGGDAFSVTLDASIKPFPWKGFDYNLGGVIAATFYSFVGTLAFQSNVVLIMKSIVVEKELRLREGMKMMGMSNTMFWSSWLMTHWLSSMISVVMICIVGLYPFEYTNQFIQFIFYTFWVASLILWNFFISTFFSRSITATIAGCFAYTVTLVPAIVTRITIPNGSGAWLAACIFPAGAMNQWGAALAILEQGKSGITWDTFGEDITTSGNVSCAGILGMVIFDCFLYALLTWYFDAVWPTEYGTRHPPWFLFTKKYWFGTESSRSDDGALKLTEQESGDAVEPLTSQQMANASVVVRGLTKRFGEVTAVNDLSVTFVPGQVSGLLGHNGAGKTTTISILTGMIGRSSGRATIDGYDTETQMDEIRASLGICPQFDVLWPTLTVREHLRLYAAFAGMEKTQVESELTTSVEEVALTEKIDNRSSDLSGGMKRKLSLAIAFIGNPSVVFLDEPTSGMDPYSRRFIWEVIRKRAKNSTVLLTTHFLDEADLLCDRIAIMTAGHLSCIGSPLFLKGRFGTGYLLTFARRGSGSTTHLPSLVQHTANNTLRLIQKFVPHAVVHSDVGAELSFSLPFESTSTFSELFKALDAQLNDLGYTSYGISCTTLEEVFLSLAHGGVKKIVKTGDESDDPDEVAANDEEGIDGHMLSIRRKEMRAHFAKGNALLFIQFKRLLWKRVLNYRRTVRSTLMQLIVPSLFTVLALYMTTLKWSATSDLSPKVLSRSLLANKRTLATYAPSDSHAAAVLANRDDGTYDVYSSHKPELSCMCSCVASGQNVFMGPYTCCAYDRSNEGTCQMQLQNAVSGTSCAKSATYDMDVQPSTFLVSGSTCSSLIDDSFDGYMLSILDAAAPCNMQSVASCDALYVDSYDSSTGVYAHTLYASQTAYHGAPTVINQANEAILRTRTSNPSASITTAIHYYPSASLSSLSDGDVIEPANANTTYIVAMFIVMGLAVLTASISIFPVYERCNNSKHLQLVSGIDKRMYWLAHFCADIVTLALPLAIIMIIFVAFDATYFRGQLGAVCSLLFMFLLTAIPHAHFMGFYYTSDYYTFVGQIGTNTFLGVVTTIAGIVTTALKDVSSTIEMLSKLFCNLFPFVIPHFSFGKGLYDLAQNGLDGARQTYVEACDCLVNVVPKSSYTVIEDDIGFLIATFFIWTSLMLFKEYQENFASWRSRKSAGAAPPDADEDEDVRDERERVLRGETSNDGVVTVRLAKSYKEKHAVRGLSVGLHRDQCFGLLGINGAGKTTTFKMLTGEFPPSAGDAIVQARDGSAHSVSKDLNGARKLMGYCPQFNGLQPNFTAREHIEFYAAIRGMPAHLIARTTEDLIQRMDLTRYADRHAGTYSGGNKRKLSVALALVGEPEVVFLDEPSTGMDPEARRFMWDVISAMTNGRTIVLTSHSMEECEALCNRIGIMVSGQFKCLGSLQHLKSRFSEGYSIDLRFADGKADAVLAALQSRHAEIGAELMEAHGTELKLRVVNPEMKLWRIFDAVEDLKTASDETFKIDDYSVSQTTLEQVFIRFAKTQNEETHDAPGLNARKKRRNANAQ